VAAQSRCHVSPSLLPCLFTGLALSFHSATAAEGQVPFDYSKNCSAFRKSNENLASVEKFQVKTNVNRSRDDQYNFEYIVDNKRVYLRYSYRDQWKTEPYTMPKEFIDGVPTHSFCSIEEEKYIFGTKYIVLSYVYKELRKDKISSYSCTISLETETLLPFERNCRSLESDGFPNFTTRWSYLTDVQAPELATP
jgi:hypothetical protein